MIPQTQYPKYLNRDGGMGWKSVCFFFNNLKGFPIGRNADVWYVLIFIEIPWTLKTYPDKNMVTFKSKKKEYFNLIRIKGQWGTT